MVLNLLVEIMASLSIPHTKQNRLLYIFVVQSNFHLILIVRLINSISKCVKDCNFLQFCFPILLVGLAYNLISYCG